MALEIHESDFKLKAIDEHTPRFDLELLYVIKARGKEPRKDFKLIAYGITLEYAIRKIAHYRIACKHKEEAITLKKYCKEFLEEVRSLTNQLDGTINKSSE